jgi:aminoglycoside phosphotransferase (APT) family kinase protein
LISDDQAAGLVQTALQVQPCSVVRQTLTESGNAIFRALLPDGRSVALRVSPHPGGFNRTPRNLDFLRELGLPVATVLGAGRAGAGSFIILSWIPGRDLLYELAGLSPEQMTGVAQAVTRCQKQVGSLPEGTGFGWAPIGQRAGAASWTELFGAPATDPVAADAPVLERLRGRLREQRRAVEAYLARVRPVCFLDDLTLRNVLVDGGALQGIIDLDTVCYGDPLLCIGSTLALIAAEVGEAGRFYGEELVRCWNPDAEGLRAIRFYAALWSIGLLSAAEAAGDGGRVRILAPAAEAMLRLGEDPGKLA